MSLLCINYNNILTPHDSSIHQKKEVYFRYSLKSTGNEKPYLDLMMKVRSANKKS